MKYTWAWRSLRLAFRLFSGIVGQLGWIQGCLKKDGCSLQNNNLLQHWLIISVNNNKKNKHCDFFSSTKKTIYLYPFTDRQVDRMGNSCLTLVYSAMIVQTHADGETGLFVLFVLSTTSVIWKMLQVLYLRGFIPIFYFIFYFYYWAHTFTRNICTRPGGQRGNLALAETC